MMLYSHYEICVRLHSSPISRLSLSFRTFVFSYLLSDLDDE